MRRSRASKYFMIFLVVLIVCAAGCGKKETPKQETVKPKEAAEPDTADQVKHKVLAFNLEGLSDKGAKKWDVKGEAAEAVSENEIKLDNVMARAYGEEASATITADKGIYDRAKNNVRLEENVKATIENTGNFAGDFIDIPGQAGKGSPSGKAKTTRTLITCDGEVQFDYENNKAYFDRNVKVVSDDGNIDADRITVNLDPETKKVKEIIAEGNVKISRGENITYSDKATYIEADKKVVLVGRPKLVIYQEGAIEGNFLGK